ASDDHYRVYHHFEQVAGDHDRLQKIRTRGHDLNCPYCEGKGIIGRAPIVEIIFLDKRGRGYIRKGDLNGWLDYLTGQGWESMEDNAAQKILRGELCPLIVERNLETPYGINGDAFNYTTFKNDIQSRRAIGGLQ